MLPPRGELMSRSGKLRAVLMSVCLVAQLSSSSFAQTRPAIVFPEAIGPWLTILYIARDQGLFAKRAVEMEFVEAKGATIPQITDRIPFGFVGGPAALIQAGNGSDLKFLAAFNRAKLAGALVARPEIKAADQLRGKRIGVRVIGAGIWI